MLNRSPASIDRAGIAVAARGRNIEDRTRHRYDSDLRRCRFRGVGLRDSGDRDGRWIGNRRRGGVESRGRDGSRGVLPLVTPFTCHVTAVLLAVSTVAVNCCVVPAVIVADIGEIEMVTPTAVVMVTAAEADLVVSA